MQNLDSIILFPVDRLLKNELRGSKGDLKRPFDRSWKDYHDKFSELERQKKKQAKEAGKSNFWLNFKPILSLIEPNYATTLFPLYIVIYLFYLVIVIFSNFNQSHLIKNALLAAVADKNLENVHNLMGINFISDIFC